MSEDQVQEVEAPPETGLAVAQPVLMPRAGQPALREVYWMSKALSAAVTLPDAIRGNPPAILAVMLAGRELGIGPMAATRMVHIINGQTSIATELKLALAKQAGHEVVAIDEGPGWCVVGCRDHPEAAPIGWKLEHETETPSIVPEWTVAADITQGSKPLIGKDNWKNYRRAMLFWRAGADFMRRHCPGVGGGLYTVEELGEGGDGDS